MLDDPLLLVQTLLKEALALAAVMNNAYTATTISSSMDWQGGVYSSGDAVVEIKDGDDESDNDDDDDDNDDDDEVLDSSNLQSSRRFVRFLDGVSLLKLVDPNALTNIKAARSRMRRQRTRETTPKSTTDGADDEKYKDAGAEEIDGKGRKEEEEEEEEEACEEEDMEKEEEEDDEDEEVVEEEEEVRKCFFLNLYHLMTAHAQMLFGPPANYLQFVKFLHRSCYELGTCCCSGYTSGYASGMLSSGNQAGYGDGGGGGEVLSIAELEHGVLRSAMSPPDQVKTE